MTKVRAQVNEETNKGQLPWGHTNLIGTVYLNGAPAPGADGVAAPAAAQTAVATAPSSDVELEFWRSIKDFNKPEELNAYLSTYPNGQFRPLALARIAALENGASTQTRNLSTGIDPATFTTEANQTTEDQIGLDKGQRRDVQRRLTGLGFDTKVTGAFDEATRGVITRWQVARGYPKSGYLNKLQHKALLTEIVATTSATSGTKKSRPASPRQQRWRRRPAAGAASHSGGADPGAAFVGGVVGGMLGGASVADRPNLIGKSPAHAGLFPFTPSRKTVLRKINAMEPPHGDRSHRTAISPRPCAARR